MSTFLRVQALKYSLALGQTVCLKRFGMQSSFQAGSGCAVQRLWQPRRLVIRNRQVQPCMTAEL